MAKGCEPAFISRIFEVLREPVMALMESGDPTVLQFALVVFTLRSQTVERTAKGADERIRTMASIRLNYSCKTRSIRMQYRLGGGGTDEERVSLITFVLIEDFVEFVIVDISYDQVITIKTLHHGSQSFTQIQHKTMFWNCHLELNWNF